MKRIFTIVVLIASLVFTSCEDFLTEDVRGQLNVDTYYKSIEECESAVTSCYQAMTYGGWWQINTVWLLSEMCGDDAWMGNTSQSQSDYILKSATKPLNVLIAFTRPLITEFADNLNLKHPLLPTISPYPTM